jgi:hypothetical protein
MNTSGQRVSAALAEIEKNARPLLESVREHLENPDLNSLETFVAAGQEFERQLIEIVHEERNPGNFDRAGMRRWLRLAWEAEMPARVAMAGNEAQEAQQAREEYDEQEMTRYIVEAADRMSAAPLDNPRAQELRARVEELLGNPSADTKMPDLICEVMQQYAYTVERVEHEEAWNVTTDSILTGYMLRIAEGEDVIALPPELATELPADLDEVTEERVDAALGCALEIADNHRSELFASGAEVWDEVEWWNHQYNTARSRDRKREMYEAAGLADEIPYPALVNNDRAFAVGYVLRCIQEAVRP